MDANHKQNLEDQLSNKIFLQIQSPVYDHHTELDQEHDKEGGGHVVGLDGGNNIRALAHVRLENIR